MLLGDTFLRNVYTLYNLGVGNANPIQSGPYVQMLSVSTRRYLGLKSFVA